MTSQETGLQSLPNELISMISKYVFQASCTIKQSSINPDSNHLTFSVPDCRDFKRLGLMDTFDIEQHPCVQALTGIKTRPVAITAFIEASTFRLSILDPERYRSFTKTGFVSALRRIEVESSHCRNRVPASLFSWLATNNYSPRLQVLWTPTGLIHQRTGNVIPSRSVSYAREAKNVPLLFKMYCGMILDAYTLIAEANSQGERRDPVIKINIKSVWYCHGHHIGNADSVHVVGPGCRRTEFTSNLSTFQRGS
jgi:hypothetical protein